MKEVAKQLGVATDRSAERRRSIESVGIIIVHDESVFLFKRDMAAPQFPGRWQFPAGQIEPDELLHEAMVRECTEEISYAPRSYTLLGLLDQGIQKAKGMYWATVDEEEAQQLTLNNLFQEGMDARFWSIDEARQLGQDQFTPGTKMLLYEYGTVIKNHALAHTTPAATELGLQSLEYEFRQ